MIRALREIRLSWPAFAIVAGTSILATALVLGSALGRSPAQSAALAALHSRREVIQLQAAQSPPAGGSAAGAGGGSAAASLAGDDANSAATPAGGSDAATDAGAGSDTGADTDDTDGSDGSDGSTVGTTTTTTTTTTSSSTLPKVAHVFEIALSANSHAAVFGAGSAAPYLRSLEARGALLSGYESLDGSELPDYIAMISGQGPNPDTRAGCQTYSEFREGTVAKANGLVDGAGCVYPETALTIGDQVTASGHVWKAYIADMGSTTCVHPNSGALDDIALPDSQPGYDTRHNPFIYFHSLLDLGDCENDDVDLGRLAHDLAKPSSTATFSFIAPGVCADAASIATATSIPSADATTPAGTAAAATTPTTSTPTTPTTSTPTTPTTSTPTTTTAAATTSTATTSPTTTETTTTPASTTPTSTPLAAASTCQAGQPAGLPAEDAFLRSWVPRILRSAAYKQDGVLVIAFAGVHSGGLQRTGALVLSPYIHGGKTLTQVYTPYSLLRSVEDMLGYTPLAHAASAASFAATLLG